MQGSPKQNAAALAILLLVLGSLGLRLWASGESSALLGPSYIGANAGHVVLEYDRQLFQLALDGSVQSSVPLAELGIDATPVGLQLLSDGHVVIGDLDARAIHRCQLPEPRCERIAPSDRFAIKKQFKFHLDEQRNRLYLTDTNRHRLLMQDLANNTLAELSAPGDLRYPNDIVVDGDGRPVIADTNHHRVAAYVPDNGVRHLLTGTPPLARNGRTWPTAIATADAGDFVVLISDGKLADADAIVYSADGNALRRLDLPADADPVAVAIQGRTALLTDPSRIAVYAANIDDGTVRRFGDERFQALLAQRAQHKQQLDRLASLGFAGLGVALVFAGLLAVKVVRQNDRQPAGRHRAPRRAVDLADIVWAPRNGEAMAKLRRALWLAGSLVTIAVVLLFPATCPQLLGSSDLSSLWAPLISIPPLVALGFALLPLTAAGTFWAFRAMLKAGIGTDGEHLYLRDGKGHVIRIAPEDILHTGRIAMYGKHAVQLQLGAYGPTFEPEPFYRDIHPLLSRGRKVSELHAMVYQILNRQPAGWLNLAVLGAALLLLAVYGLD